VRKDLCVRILLLAFLGLLSGCQVQLYDNLDERQANEILAALLEHNLTASKAAGEEGKYRILVEESQFAWGMKVLESRGLPRPKYDTFGEVFKKSGILSSPTEERARYVYALSQELSRTLSEIDGVLAARVHVVLPQESDLGEELVPAAVSVFVKYSEAFPFDVPARTADVRKLVESSVQGLSPDRIQIVMSPSAPQVELPSESSGAFVSVLGVRAARESSRALILLFGALGVLLVAVLLGGGWLLFRQRFARKAGAGGTA